MSRFLVQYACLALFYTIAMMTPTGVDGKNGRDRRNERRLQAAQDVDLYTYTVRRTYPHDPNSFTQGLLYNGDNLLYESAGMYGESTLREVNLTSGQVLRSRKLDPRDFAEGLTLHRDRLLQLTWRCGKGIAYDRETFEVLSEFDTGLRDGWGFTNENMQSEELVVTDSGSMLFFLNPDTFKVKRKIQVHDNGRHVNWLNELEWIDGEIWANVWQTDCVARIDPETGRVKAWILLQGLKSSLLTDHPPHARHRMDVLNGIAYDKTNGRLFVTGKWWPRMFELELRRIDWPPEMDVANARQLCIK
mmetsp:Transcript_32263/g.54173  ORF Transcript_32263/g.54173 Transcript_32263/m.54173 type:complete len:304 (+) Transcript_32263:287-1198(+)